ncbi:N-acetylmuramoyl-L-alanine amidase [Myroides ceti]|uniref:N-acetylmuramoyl-L-alanine amidase n=1 Tax=Paenimyroides ceti TaxID=395087 RepID=A0ABT8CQJ5_9FLAO|nr:N-acetylmuramoyl-L-alanine amidase [Paenimyroides ceti]MDN3706625.1 N-acetylmuramoyl-L-alanine amidase [Paenimyroides ceti]
MLIKKIKLVLVGVVLFCSASGHAQKFKVVLDPGHGGKDFGATRSNYVEKKIVLDVALKVGEILEKDKSIDVVYTRKTDVFIPLNGRTNIANKEKADVFISIHANAVPNSPDAAGTETFVMGVSKNKSHLEVAKKENAVITLEEDYKNTYAGYDPSSPESIIGLTLVQEQFIAQSIELASFVQSKFTNELDRKNRGVKQAGFLVLYTAFMPSVLIELGFLSNSEEGAYLNSDKGKNEMARSIANAILDYKKKYHSPNNIKNTTEPKSSRNQDDDTPKSVRNTEERTEVPEVKNYEPEPVRETKKGVVFMVQVAASSKNIATSASNFKGLSNITSSKEGTLYKYYYNETSDIAQARKSLETAKQKGYDSAFIVAFKDGKKINLQEALK